MRHVHYSNVSSKRYSVIRSLPYFLREHARVCVYLFDKKLLLKILSERRPHVLARNV